MNNVVGLAKTARVFGVPTILTTMLEARGGLLIPQLQEVFPDQKPIDRAFINTWEDQRVVAAVQRTGRRKLIIAALWTEICLAMPAIHALADGYEVYVVTDASGGVTAEAHDMAVRRMMQAGCVPITWMAVMGEWQRDWARQGSIPGVAEVLGAHGGGSGVAFTWEMQLLAAGAAWLAAAFADAAHNRSDPRRALHRDRPRSAWRRHEQHRARWLRQDDHGARPGASAGQPRH
jgi:nicotinamidase-related amidase